MQLGELKSLLSRFHIRPDHKLGQNFLLSEEVLDQITAGAELGRRDVVLEIGPGLGVLTRRLAEQAGQVYAVEKDKKIYQALKKIFKSYKNIHLIRGNALFIKPEELLHSRTKEPEENVDSSSVLPFSNYKVVANIPYYLTGQILQNFLTAVVKPSLMVLLVQKEVGERMVAGPGEMSVLAVSVQLYADPMILAEVRRENFYPQPEVDSVVIRLKIFDRPRFAVHEKTFFQLVKIGFGAKRKQLQNNLKAGFGPGDYHALLAELKLNPKVRAQDLSLVDWVHLYEKLKL